MAGPEEEWNQQTTHEATGEILGAEAPKPTFLEIAFICNTLRE